MLNIKEIKGTSFKKILGCKSSSFRWHNKNKSGGNFGIELRELQGKDYEISGEYNINGNMSSIRFGYIYQAGVRFMIEDFEELINIIKKMIGS